MEIKVTIPYDTCLSKNQTHYNVSVRKRVRTKAYVEMLKVIDALIKKEMSRLSIAFHTRKVWVDIMIFRPNMRADPINFLDALSDAVKGAISIDDRYFAGSWNWVIDKQNPRIEIIISQEE